MFQPAPPTVQFVLDASGSFGCGAVWLEAWLQVQWPREYRAGALRLNEEGITLLELLPVILASVVWGSRWRHQSVLVLCDNAGAVACINSGYSREPHLIHMLRCLFFIRAAFGISLWAVHIPGKLNDLADAVSRDNLPYLFSQVPGSFGGQQPVPVALLDLLVGTRPDWTSPRWARLFRSSLQQI